MTKAGIDGVQTYWTWGNESIKNTFKNYLHKTKFISIFDYSIMPTGISIIISQMSYKRPFKSGRELDALIKYYFSYAHGKPQTEADDTDDKTIPAPPPGGPTLAGLAFYLGFNTFEEFEMRESKGRFATRLKRARLYIEAIYESRLQTTSGGAIYALKTMGHSEKGANKPQEEQDNTLKVEIINAGPQLAGSEKEVSL